MRLQAQRKAFSMITAIFVILIMASIGAFVMNLSGKMVKETTTQFQREQAVLLAKSYTEYAIMAVMANDANATGNCLETIQGDDVIRDEADGGFNVRVEIAYLGNGNGRVSSCGNLSNSITTPESPLNILVDVYVKYQDLDREYSNSADAIKITYHRRTLQKI